jgi:hypothetical protein
VVFTWNCDCNCYQLMPIIHPLLSLRGEEKTFIFGHKVHSVHYKRSKSSRTRTRLSWSSSTVPVHVFLSLYLSSQYLSIFEPPPPYFACQGRHGSTCFSTDCHLQGWHCSHHVLKVINVSSSSINVILFLNFQNVFSNLVIIGMED